MAGDLNLFGSLKFVHRYDPQLGFPQIHAEDEDILCSTLNKNQHGAARGHLERFGPQPGPVERPRQDSPFFPDSETIPGGSP